MKGTTQQQVMSDAGQQQGLYYQQPAQQSGYNTQLQQGQQYLPQQETLLQQQQQQQQQQGSFGGLSTQSMLPAFKSGRSDLQQQQQAYHINAQAYDSINYAQQQYGVGQLQGQLQQEGLVRGQSLANGQPGVLTRGQSFANGQPGILTRGQSFANGQFSSDQGVEGYLESPRLEVLVTPNFSSQELNMLLEVTFCLPCAGSHDLPSDMLMLRILQGSLLDVCLPALSILVS